VVECLLSIHKVLGKGKGKELIHVTKEVMGNPKSNRHSLHKYYAFPGKYVSNEYRDY
jgi:hypothetical protein